MRSDLERKADDLLIESIGPALRESIHKLARRPMSWLTLRTILISWIRKASGRKNTFVELGALAYVDRLESGEIPLPPAPTDQAQKPTDQAQKSRGDEA